MPVCSWVMSRNKSLLSTREQNQPCTKDISTTLLVPLPEVERRSKILRTSSTIFIPASISPRSFRMCSCLSLKPKSDRLLTSIHYKETDTQSYLNYTSSHPACCKNSIPYSQFLRLQRICSEENDFENKSKEMASFFQHRGYLSNVVQRAQERVSAIPHDTIISECSDVPDAQPTIPLVLTDHPTNALVKNIMTRNFHLLRDDPDTRDIYQPVRVLCAHHHDKNLCDSLVRSHLNNTTASVEDCGTFPCGQSWCNSCAHTNASPTIRTKGGTVG